MYIKSLQIENYKSFGQSTKITFSKGFNVVIGKNGVGKTALLEALQFGKINKVPFLSPNSKPSPNSDIISNNKRIVTLSFNRTDFKYWIKRQHFHIRASSELPDGTMTSKFASLFNDDQILNLMFAFQNDTIEDYIFDLRGNELINSSSRRLVLLYDRKSNIVNLPRHNPGQGVWNVEDELYQILRKIVYSFHAERRISGKVPLNGSRELHSDASNLVNVLHYLYNTNRAKYDRYLSYVRKVFPEIHFIDMPSVAFGNTVSADQTTYSATVQMRFWHLPMDSERGDLTISFEKTGTGYGQALAMLYVVVTADYPKIVLIDEPQSYLHPSAIRRLFDIFKEFPQHQYIITTHSPIVISAADPDNIILLSKDDGMESKVQLIDMTNRFDMEMILNNIGARLSDVFGADTILWVEGSTEEKCFPNIIRQLCKQSFIGTNVVAVKRTSDFDDKSKIDMIVDLLDTLSKGNALVPPAVGLYI